MSYLLLPTDEQELVGHLWAERGWHLLDGSIERGRPVLITKPSGILSAELPVAGDGGSGPVWVFLFWSPEWGPAVAIGDAPEPADVVRRVLRRNRAALLDAVDPHATPLIIYRRCHWAADGGLGLGFLQGMDRPRKDWPPPFRRAFGQAERWLKRGAVKIDPFEYGTDETRVPDVVTWVRPAAWSWIQGGGRLWTGSF